MMGERVQRFPLAVTRRLSLFPILLALAGLGWVTASAFAIAGDPWLGAAVGIAPIGFVLLLNSPIVRLTWYILGALAVFQLPDSASSAKLLYLGGTLIISGTAAVNLVRHGPGEFRAFRPIIFPTALLIAAVAGATLIGLAQNDSTLVIRDSIPYVLLIVAPLVGLDIALTFKPGFLYGFIAVFSVIASVGFASDWLTRRGVSALPFGKFLLSTTVIGGLGLAIALIHVTRSRGISRLMWLATIIIIPVMYFLSGARTALTLGAVVIGVLGRRGAARAPALKLATILAIAGVLAALALPFITTLAISDPSFLTGRLSSALSALQNGVTSDASGQLRLQSYGWAIDAWDSNWVFGTGFGHSYPNGFLSLDTPLMIPAKFGAVGAAAVLIFLGAIAVVIKRSQRVSGSTPAHTVARAFYLFLITLTPFLPITEDKGLPLAIALLVAIVASESINAVGSVAWKGTDNRENRSRLISSGIVPSP